MVLTNINFVNANTSFFMHVQFPSTYTNGENKYGQHSHMREPETQRSGLHQIFRRMTFGLRDKMIACNLDLREMLIYVCAF